MISEAETLVAEALAQNPAFLEPLLAQFTTTELAALNYDWDFWARPEQIPPRPDFLTWLLMGGRRSGKTRCASEYVLKRAMLGQVKSVLFIGTNELKVQKTMLTGPSGLVTISPPWFKPQYLKSESFLVYPNGVTVQALGSENPDASRAYECGLLWLDEVAEWATNTYRAAIMNATMANSADPGQRIITTTPRKGHPFLRELVEASQDPERRICITNPRTSQNPFATAEEAVRTYSGTELGRQELEGELLEDTEGTLFQEAWIHRIPKAPESHLLSRIVVAVDPSKSDGPYAGEAGIVAVALGRDGYFYVLEDDSGKCTPDAWARRAVALHEKWKAHSMVVEINMGEVETLRTIRRVSASIVVEKVTASRGKALRAEPVAAMYEQGRVKHLSGLQQLEREMLTWSPSSPGRSAASPGRLDAMVWGLTKLSDRAPVKETEKQHQFVIPRGESHRGGIWR